jgi:hypothetical protein
VSSSGLLDRIDRTERGTACGTIGSPRSSSPRLVWSSKVGEILMDGVSLCPGTALARKVKSTAQPIQYSIPYSREVSNIESRRTSSLDIFEFPAARRTS